MEQVNAQLEETEAKAATGAKQVSNLESQLADSQDMLQEETRHKLALQSKLRQAEEKLEGLADQVDEEEEAKRNLETKCTSLNQQVISYCGISSAD